MSLNQSKKTKVAVCGFWHAHRNDPFLGGHVYRDTKNAQQRLILLQEEENKVKPLSGGTGHGRVEERIIFYEDPRPSISIFSL